MIRMKFQKLRILRYMATLIIVSILISVITIHTGLNHTIDTVLHSITGCIVGFLFKHRVEKYLRRILG